VVYTNYSEVAEASSTQFEVRPKIVVTLDPDGADTKLTVGETYTNLVKWTYSGNTTGRKVQIRYDTNSGIDGYPDTQKIAEDIDANSGGTGVTWSNVPSIIGASVRIKVFDQVYTNAAGESPVFKVAGKLILTGPTNGITKTASTDTDVTWNFKGAINSVNVYYDMDTTNGLQWTLVGNKVQGACAESCSYTWTTTNSPAFPSTVGNNYRIKITNALLATNPLYVESEGTNFKIGAQFNISSPENGSPVYAEDTDEGISWVTPKGSSVDKVHLYYSNSDLSLSAADPTTLGWIRITPVDGVANSSPYNWNPIPRELTELSTTTHRVLITQADPVNEEFVYNVGEGSVFPIFGVLEVTSPVNLDSWSINSTVRIKWTKKGDLQSVNVWYDPDDDAFDGNEIKLTDTAIDISDATGDVNKDVDDKYFFDWFIPMTTVLTNEESGKIWVKAVTPGTQTSVKDDQTGNIEVKGSVTLKKPGGVDDPGGPDEGDKIVLKVGDTDYDITWSATGEIDQVKLYYSTDGGDTFPESNLIGTFDASPSIYDEWIVPDAVDTDIRIQVQDAGNANVKDPSDYDFRIKGELKVITPSDAGLYWKVNETNRLIEWESTGTFSQVEIQYDTDGDFETTADTFPIKPTSVVSNCTPTAPSITCNGQVPWKPIPDIISSTVKIRVRGTNSEIDVEDESDSNFKIVGTLDVKIPESGQIWYIGETTKKITWDAFGSVTNLKIGYKTSAAGDCNWITTNDGGHDTGSNEYSWNPIDDVQTETAYICLADKDFEDETLVYSDNAFKIRPKIIVDQSMIAAEPPGPDNRLEIGGNYANLIKWTITGTQTPLLEIRYSLDGGADGYPVNQMIDNNIEYDAASIAWNNIPPTKSTNVTLKIFDQNKDYISGDTLSSSLSSFKIVGKVFNVKVRDADDENNIVNLKYGQNYLITWESNGPFSSDPELDNVKIFSSPNGGAGDSYPLPISNGTSRGEGSFAWEGIPATLSSDVVIRVSDFYDVEARGLSPNVKIQSILDITRPEVANLILAAGEPNYSVEWSTTGWELGDNVLLQYSVDNGDWLTMAGAGQPYPNADGSDDNSFPWDIPLDVISDNVRVRGVDGGNDDGRPSDLTNFNIGGIPFEVRAGLNMISPIGNTVPDDAEKWLVGSTHKITWGLIGYMDTVKIQISVDGAAFTDIPEAGQITAPTGIPADEGDPGVDPTYGWVWTIPDSISKQVKIQVVNEDDTDVVDASPKNFNIVGKLDFNPTLPVGGDTVWEVGDSRTIVWVPTGDITKISLQYSKNGDDYFDIPGATDLSGDTKSITIPDIIDPDVTIRAINYVNDGSKPTIPAVSGNIEVKGQLTIDSPVLNDLWQVDNTYEILWTPTGTMATVKLEYSTNGFEDGTEDYEIEGPLDESAVGLDAGDTGVQQIFVWKIPNTIISNTVTVRVTNEADGNVIGDSGLMKIVGWFEIITPNGGGFFQVDRNTPLQWMTHGAVTNAQPQYSTDGFATESPINIGTAVSAGPPGTGSSISWQVPNAIGPNVRVRVVDPDSEYVFSSGICAPPGSETCTISDISDEVFEIRGEIEFKDGDSPEGGEAWLIDETHTIQWTTHGTVGNVNVQYYSNLTTGYEPVLNSDEVPATGIGGYTWIWKIPDDKGVGNVVVRVTQATDSNVTIDSSPLTIRGGFYWTNPSVINDPVFVDSTEVLTWTTFGTIGFVDLKYSLTGVDGTYNFMKKSGGVDDADDVSNEFGSFNWKIPDDINQAVYIRVIDYEDPVEDPVSFATFGPIKIAGKLYVTEPDNDPVTERWAVGTTHNIAWTMDGTVDNVKIEYSLSGGEA
ncbi:MAG: hypothetical protein KAR31_13740, partial [Candidatus Omnitrophica bacterium]|nr:hypothetical protein [Candidatus Omnitrophota bacterium]